MVTHCANPKCNAPLHYLRSGRLFRFELRPPLQPCRDVPSTICAAKPARATVFFWLCESCARQFSLKFSPGQGIELIALQRRGKSSTQAPSVAATTEQRLHGVQHAGFRQAHHDSII